MNDAAVELFGYSSREELMQLKISDLYISAEERTRHSALIEERGYCKEYPVDLCRKDGTVMHTLITSVALCDAGKNVIGFQGTIRDITARKQAEEQALIFRNFAEASGQGIGMATLDGAMTYVNPTLCRMLGEDKPEGVYKKKFSFYYPLEMRERLEKEVIPAVMSTGQWVGELALISTTGKYTPTIENFFLIRDEAGNPLCLADVITDISDRKRVEEVLRESEKKYRLLADNVFDVIYVMDMNLNYTYVSPSVKILMGYEPEEMLKLPSIELMTPSSWDLVQKTLSEVLELEKFAYGEISRPRTLQLEMRRKDGVTIWTEVKVSFLRDENQQPMGILGVTRDITERRRTEEELRQTLESLRKAVNTTVQVMVSAVEVRDPYTAGHQIRSANLACAIGAEMGLPQEKTDGIRMAGSIHDIGKLSIPAEILSKPTKLSEIEFALIKEHSRSGYEMLKDVESPWPLAQIVYQHHERMNGSGYPRNLKGDEILMEARIMAVADVVESMASHRPYRPSLGIEAALEEIEKNKGTLYDEAVVDACLRLFREKGFQLR